MFVIILSLAKLNTFSAQCGSEILNDLCPSLRLSLMIGDQASAVVSRRTERKYREKIYRQYHHYEIMKQNTNEQEAGNAGRTREAGR